MKILSVKQPWAWLIAEGHKDVENRGRGTTHRGEVVIQVSQTWVRAEVEKTILWLVSERLVDEEINMADLYAQRGHAIAVVELFDVVEDSKSPWAVDGEKHLKMRNVRKLGAPIKMKGALGLVTLDGEGVEAVTRGLTASKAIAGLRSIAQSGKAATAIKGLALLVLERCTVKVVSHKPHGTLPMDVKFCVRVRDPEDGAELYDSASLPDDAGLFETEVGAEAHSASWYEAQRARLLEVDSLQVKRRLELPSRLDEIDEAGAKVNAAAKLAQEGRKACAADHAGLRAEARAPAVEIIWSAGGFAPSPSPSLSERTDRGWYGSKGADGEMLVPPLGGS